MDKTVTLSKNEIDEIIKALSKRAESLLAIANEIYISMDSEDDEEVLAMYCDECISYRRKGYYIHSLMSKLENL